MMNRGVAYFTVFLLALLAAAVFPSLFSEKAAGEKISFSNEEAASVFLSSEEMEPPSTEAVPRVITPSFERKGEEVPPPLGAERVMVADVKSGDIFYAAKENERWPLASLAKLMTGLVAMRHMDASVPVTLLSSDFVDGEDETRSLKIGGTYRTEDLLWALLVESSNEAAEALARSYLSDARPTESSGRSVVQAGGRERFIGEMNAVVLDWGLYNTHFDDPSGISAASQATAADMHKLVTLIYYEHPEIFEKTRKQSRTITELTSKKTVAVRSTDKFAGQIAFLGGKTGYTDEASGNLLTLFSYARRPILIVVLGTADRFGDTESLFTWFKNNFEPSGVQ